MGNPDPHFIASNKADLLTRADFYLSERRGKERNVTLMWSRSGAPAEIALVFDGIKGQWIYAHAPDTKMMINSRSFYVLENGWAIACGD